MDNDTGKLRAEYAALDVRPGEEWFAYMHKGGYDLCVESARRQADHPNAATDAIVGRFACGSYALRCLPVVATALNALPTLLDTIDTLRQQLAEARAAAFHPDGESYRELWLVSKANAARAAKVANEYRGMIKTVCIIPNCQRPAPDNEPFCSKHRDYPRPRIGGQP